MKRLSPETEKIVRLICFFSCIIFVLAHVLYFTLFAIIDVKILMYINIGSTTYYLLLLLIVKFRLYNTYVFLATGEIAIYMATGTLILGMDAGFYLCFIALATLTFFAGYFSKSNNDRIKPVIMTAIIFLLFIGSYIWLMYKEPYMIIKPTYYSILYISHIIIQFGFVTAFLAFLTSYTVKLEKKVLLESETDKLTNIANRKGLVNYYEKLGDSKNNYIVAIFDIDNFKKFNDKNGHLCGDYVLKEIARIANENSKDDFVSRWGGEEFVVISKKDEDINDTYKKIDRIRETICNFDFNYDNKNLKSTITIGVAQYNDDQSLDDWITRADEKLYYGKHNGKNQMVV